MDGMDGMGKRKRKGSHTRPLPNKHSKPEEQVDLAAAAAAGVPVIRRFSGGGSVVVDEHTLLVGLAGTAAAVVGEGAGENGVELGPRGLMAWTEGVYGPVFGGVGPFALRENGEKEERRERMEREGWIERDSVRAFVFPRPLTHSTPAHPPLLLPATQTTSSAT
jgi:hypothetical protein